MLILNFWNIDRKAIVLESLINKVAALQVCNLSKETPAQMFSCKNFQYSKNTYFEEHLRPVATGCLEKFSS